MLFLLLDKHLLGVDGSRFRVYRSDVDAMCHVTPKDRIQSRRCDIQSFTVQLKSFGTDAANAQRG